MAHDPSSDKIKLGSVWYVDVVATDIEKVQSVTVDIDLNNMSRWELAHLTTAKGFTASYFIQDDENIATITITRTGENDRRSRSRFSPDTYMGAENRLYLHERNKEGKRSFHLCSVQKHE